MRGFPETLVLKRLKPRKTKRRAPGPGAIRKRDWKPIAKEYLENRKVILHADGARTSKLKVPGVLHDMAVHKKMLVIKNGVRIWMNPKYSELHTHITPDKTKVHVKTGTQIIDRFWKHLRGHLGTMKRKTGSATLESRIRSAQFTYWYKGQDLWLKTGDMLEELMQ